MSGAQWLSLLLAGLKIVSAIASWLQRRQIINEVETRLLADALKEYARTVEKANAARMAQRQRNGSVPADNELPDDGWRRD